jgi:O-antigen ligase
MLLSLRYPLEIDSGLVSVLLLVLFVVLVRKRFEIALSVFVVGFYIIQYTEINLFVWRGSLIAPAIVILLARLITVKNRNKKKLGGIAMIGFIVVSVYFLSSLVRSYINNDNMYLFVMSTMIGTGLIYGPFYGMWKIANNTNLIVNHIKYNAYISTFIAVGFIVMTLQGSNNITDNAQLRTTAFLGMPLGGFSYLALWSYFYHLSSMLSQNKKRTYSYIAIIISIAAVLLSQTRGLLLSIAVGTIVLFYIAQKKGTVLWVTFLLFGALLALDSFVSVGSENQQVSLVSIYEDRLTSSLVDNSGLYDSRFDIWTEAISVIMQHPLGGGRISHTVGVHNIYLSIMLQWGVLGGVFIVIILFVMLYYVKIIVYRMRFRVSSQEVMIVGMVGIAILQHSLVGGMLGSTISTLFWSIAVIVRSSEIFNVQSVNTTMGNLK